MFGANLMRTSEDTIASDWHLRWLRIIEFHRRQYFLPCGSVGDEFISQLGNEIDHLSKGTMQSEKVIIYCAVILQKDPSVRKACDIRRLLKRRISLWKEGHYDELLQEAVRCDKQFSRKHEKKSTKSN
jgi:hypothetical protein